MLVLLRLLGVNVGRTLLAALTSHLLSIYFSERDGAFPLNRRCALGCGLGASCRPLYWHTPLGAVRPRYPLLVKLGHWKQRQAHYR